MAKVQIDTHLALLAGCGVGIAGFTVLALGFFQFRAAKTTIDPVNLRNTSSLVTSGIYRVTRNPMYVGFTLLLVGWAVFLRSPWALIGPSSFVVFTNLFQILPEERAMAARFGQPYQEYMTRVRRWV